MSRSMDTMPHHVLRFSLVSVRDATVAQQITNIDKISIRRNAKSTIQYRIEF